MRVLILGADGQVGHELCAVLSCFADVLAARRADVDLRDLGRLRETLAAARPDVVVNAASYNDVDGAEREPEVARAINARAVEALGEEARRRRFGLVHYSTDFVFDGEKAAPYVESDPAAPVNAYGRSKLEGERLLRALDAPAVILRTAWVYSLRRKSFVMTILRLARERPELRVVDDQVGSPTFCRDLAEATALLLAGMRSDPRGGLEQARGVYHLAGEGSVSRHGLATAALELDPRRDQHTARAVLPIASGDLPLPARRPLRTALDCGAAWRRFGVRLPPWREGLVRALAG